MEKNRSFADFFIEAMREGDLQNNLPEDECVVPYAGAKKTLIELLFLKTILTKKDIVIRRNPDDYDLWDDFKSMFTSAASGYDRDALTKALNMLERNYNLPQGILEIESFKNLLSSHWDLIDENFREYCSRPLNGDYASSIADLISRPQSSKDTAETHLHYTNESLQHLTAGILNVKSNETFMDCCCGMYSSALYNDAAEYIGVEQNKEMAGIAAMILIMCKKKFNIKLANFVESKDENIADKILADISYGVSLPKMDEQPYGKNGEAYCIENVINALKDGGSATIVCSGSVLGKQDSSKKMREAITKDHLKAVIALPPMNNGTKSNTNLIVLQKNCHAKEIRFINASNLEIKNKNRLTLNESDISDIIGCLNGENSKCLFKDIPVEDILNSDSISWTPNNYVKGEEKSKGRSVEEIDKDLNESYKELKELFLD